MNTLKTSYRYICIFYSHLETKPETKLWHKSSIKWKSEVNVNHNLLL